MSEDKNPNITPKYIRGQRNGSTGQGVRGFLQEMERAYRKGYRIPPEDEERAVQVIRDAMLNGSIRERIAAVRTQVAMKMANLAEDKLDQEDRHADNREAIARINAMVSSPEARKLLAELTGRTLTEQPNTEAPPARADEVEGGEG